MEESNPLQPQPSVPGNANQGNATLSCEAWESLLPEALDVTLSAKDRAAFEEHSRKCAACAQMLKEAEQGADWLRLLEAPLEPPPELLDKILSRTSGKERPRPLVPSGVPARTLFPVTWRMLESRSLRTAAMAFFSLVLTLNLMDFKLSEIRLADLRPAVLQTQLSRQYYSANAQVVRYYENTRFVHEMEALIWDLRQSPATDFGDSQRSPASRNGGDGHGTSGLAFAAIETVRDSTGGLSSDLAKKHTERKALIDSDPDDRDSGARSSDSQAPSRAKGSAA